MFSLFIVLLHFSESLAHNRLKFLFLNDEPCLIRPTFININPVGLKYYPFRISLNQFRMGIFRAAHGQRGGGQKGPPP